jgi:PKD repeat protein
LRENNKKSKKVTPGTGKPGPLILSIPVLAAIVFLACILAPAVAADTSNATTATTTTTASAGLVAGFSGDVTNGAAPHTVHFTDQSSGDIVSWNWDFGDGTTHGTARNPAHVYETEGTYTVTLVVTNRLGATNTYSAAGYVSVSNPVTTVTATATTTTTGTTDAVTAAFSGTPRSGAGPLTVAFTDSSTGSHDGWSWNFGDGGTSSKQNPTHTYTVPGSYTVWLTVFGEGGRNTTKLVDYITVLEEATPVTTTQTTAPVTSVETTIRTIPATATHTATSRQTTAAAAPAEPPAQGGSIIPLVIIAAVLVIVAAAAIVWYRRRNWDELA